MLHSVMWLFHELISWSLSEHRHQGFSMSGPQATLGQHSKLVHFRKTKHYKVWCFFKLNYFVCNIEHSLAGEQTHLLSCFPAELFDLQERRSRLWSGNYYESEFSAMNIVKWSYQSRLTNEHLDECQAITTFVPRFKQLIVGKWWQFPH